MILYMFPLTWEVGTIQRIFLRERIFCEVKNIQFDLTQFEWFDRYKVTIKECLGGNEIENIQFEFSQIE